MSAAAGITARVAGGGIPPPPGAGGKRTAGARWRWATSWRAAPG